MTATMVLSDLHIGDASYPVKTLTLKHAAIIAGYVETDYFMYTENISGMPLLPDTYPICVPLGDQSLQDVYDLVDDKQGCSLFVITDRELKAEDYDFFDAIPVAILPESALDTIQAAIITPGARPITTIRTDIAPTILCSIIEKRERADITRQVTSTWVHQI